MKRLIPIPVMLVTLLGVGTIGFRIVTHASWMECLYLSVIFLTTVGAREPTPLTRPAMLFIILYLVCGMGIFTYAAFQLGQWFFSARLQLLMERRRMEREIRELKNHFVVCGFGRMGEVICGYLAERGKPFVVIDTDQARLESVCIERSWLYICGDATDDKVLRLAKVDQAKALAAVLPTDADNLYVSLASRMLNPSLQIVARANDERAVSKMVRAGANRVISPVTSGAMKMARFLLNPHIEDFLGIADARGSHLELAEVVVDEKNPYVGKKLKETDLRERGIMIIGIRRANGERLIPPSASANIEVGDCLLAFGSAEAINEMVNQSEES